MKTTTIILIFFAFITVGCRQTVQKTEEMTTTDTITGQNIEIIPVQHNERKVKYFFRANGGSVIFFDDGTAYRCARCELDENLESYEPNITYKEFPTCLLMEGDIRWELYDENGNLTIDWVIVDYRRVEHQNTDVTCTIKFSDFITVTLTRLSVWNEENELDKVHKDSVYLYIELGETIEGQLLSVVTTELRDIKVAQRYETSITVMNEGPHCDLINWKHYNSEWKQLERNETGDFVCEKYTRADAEKFPAITVEELKEAVKTHCNEGWLELINNINAPTEYPSGVGISRYFLKVTGVRKQDNQLVEKIIILENPMGC